MLYNYKRFCEPVLQDAYDLMEKGGTGMVYRGEQEYKLNEDITVSRGSFSWNDTTSSNGRIAVTVVEVIHNKMDVVLCITPYMYDLLRVADPEVTFWNIATRLLSSNGLAELAKHGVEFAYYRGVRDGKQEIRKGFTDLMTR